MFDQSSGLAEFWLLSVICTSLGVGKNESRFKDKYTRGNKNMNILMKIIFSATHMSCQQLHHIIHDTPIYAPSLSEDAKG